MIKVLVYDSLDGELRTVDVVDTEERLLTLMQSYIRPFGLASCDIVVLEFIDTDLPIYTCKTSAGRETKYYAFRV